MGIKQSVYALGEVVAIVFGDEIPPKILAALPQRPLDAIALIMREAARDCNQMEMASAMERISDSIPEVLPAVMHGAFWCGYAGQLLFGERWQTALAHAVQCSDRTMRRYT